MLFKRNIVFVSVFCFIVALFIALLHHHDNSFRLLNCSLCKVKASVSVISKKIDVDSGVAVVADYLPLLESLPYFSKIITDDASVIPFSASLFSITNKSPPYVS